MACQPPSCQIVWIVRVANWQTAGSSHPPPWSESIHHRQRCYCFAGHLHTYSMRIGTQTTSKNTILNREKQKILHQMINRLFGRIRQHFIWQCTCVISEPQKFLGNVHPTHPPIPPPPGFAAISATCVSYQITKTILGRKIFFFSPTLSTSAT